MKTILKLITICLFFGVAGLSKADGVDEPDFYTDYYPGLTLPKPPERIVFPESERYGTGIDGVDTCTPHHAKWNAPPEKQIPEPGLSALIVIAILVMALLIKHLPWREELAAPRRTRK